jgi:hypothetical protein
VILCRPLPRNETPLFSSRASSPIHYDRVIAGEQSASTANPNPCDLPPQAMVARPS